MKVKELIERLKKHDGNKEVLIRFSLDEDDDLGYYLEPIITYDHFENVYLMSEYTTTKEDCAIVGQVDLREAYKKMIEE